MSTRLRARLRSAALDPPLELLQKGENVGSSGEPDMVIFRNCENFPEGHSIPMVDEWYTPTNCKQVQSFDKTLETQRETLHPKQSETFEFTVDIEAYIGGLGPGTLPVAVCKCRMLIK